MFKKGFSLIELLVVIAIIGLLAAVIMPNIYQARAKGRDAKRIADISQLRLALEHYAEFDAEYNYPDSLEDLTPDFITEVPSDPQGGNYSYAALGSGTSCTGFHLGVSLERNHSELESDSDASAGTECSTSEAEDFDGDDDHACGNPSDTSRKCYDIIR